jgi:ribonuclease HI
MMCNVEQLQSGFLYEEYPQDLWIRIYIDGSTQNAIENGGADVYIEYPNKTTETIRIPTGNCHNYDAEIHTIKIATERLLNFNLGTQPVLFLTDATSAIQVLQSRKSLSLQVQLSQLCNQRKVTLQWIPFYCGVPGNEKADRLAKEGAREEQPDSHVTYHQKKKMIRSIRKSPASIQDDYQIITRQEQVIFRLRAGHNRHRGHMYTRFKISNSAMCT